MSVKTVKNKSYIIGLTGGIATGKSTAANYFAKKNIPVIDSDLIVKTLWKNNIKMKSEAEMLFGFTINQKNDFKKIATLIFNDKKLRMKLNDLIHPYVFLEIEKELKALKDHPIIVIDMPLLFEVGYEKKCDIVCLVYISKQTQLNRLMIRDQISIEQATKKIEAQMDIEHKKLKADVILDNEAEIDYLYFQIDQFIKGVQNEK